MQITLNIGRKFRRMNIGVNDHAAHPAIRQTPLTAQSAR
jgi:hypothetical protein